MFLNSLKEEGAPRAQRLEYWLGLKPLLDTITDRSPNTCMFASTLTTQLLLTDCTKKVQHCRTYIHTWQLQNGLCAELGDYSYLLLPQDSHFDFQTSWMHHPVIRGSVASYAQHCCLKCLVETYHPALLPQPDCLHSHPKYLNQSVYITYKITKTTINS